MRAIAPWAAAAAGACLLVANLVLVLSAKGDVAALRAELARAGTREHSPSAPAPAVVPADLAELRAGLEKSMSEKLDSLAVRPGPVRPARVTVPTISMLEAEGQAFYERQLETVVAGRLEEARTTITNAAGRYDKSSFGAKIKKLAEMLGYRIVKAQAADFAKRGRRLAAEGKLTGGPGTAEDAFSNANVRDPANPEYHKALGDLLMRAGRYQGAERAYKLVAALTSLEPFGHLLRARARVKMGDRDGAVEDCEAALKVHPENLEAKKLLESLRE